MKTFGILYRVLIFSLLIVGLILPVDTAEAAEITTISVGSHHTVALMADGTVQAWGNNGYGQLGNGTLVHSTTPITVIGLGGTVTAIAAGRHNTVVLMADGTVKAWGYNSDGQLGNGTTVSSMTPVTVTGLGDTVTAIAVGGYHSVALMADGTVRAWGRNVYGQLGNGTDIDSTTPITVIGLGGPVTAIAAGNDHTVALMADGKVKGWGNNTENQLGNGKSGRSALKTMTPVPTADLGGTGKAIAAGHSRTVALMADGTVKTWGGKIFNIGDDAMTTSIMPVTATGLGGIVTAIGAGFRHTAALMADGTVKTWGDNSNGQLGNGTLVNSDTPVKVKGLGSAVKAISVGGGHSMALMADGTFKAWGRNNSGQFGNGTTDSSTTPVIVTGFGDTSKAID